MADIISGVATSVGRDQVAKALTSILASSKFSYFIIGEAGFVTSGGAKTPKDPDPTRTRLESQGTKLTGTATFTSGSAAVVGVGTLFTTQLAVGMWVRPDSPVDGRWFQVLAIADNTHLTLASNFIGSTGSSALSQADAPYFMFKKALGAPDALFMGAGSGAVRISTLVDFAEANANWLAAAPEFFEVGIFDNNDVMMIYGTFPFELKNDQKTLNNVMRAFF